MCEGTGFITTLNEKKYIYAFRCTCNIGQKSNPSIPTWQPRLARYYTPQNGKHLVTMPIAKPDPRQKTADQNKGWIDDEDSPF